MLGLHRNQLVWLTEAGWQQVFLRSWDSQAQDILNHWHRQQLPLVVCRQRLPEAYGSISLGLPAPLQWERRKLALDVAVSEADTAFERVGDFPLLNEDMLRPADIEPVRYFLRQLALLQLSARVYGSYGWQYLSGLPCVRERSDLDLLVAVTDRDAAGQAVRLLQGLPLSCKVDGELLFPDGQAVAWREYQQLLGGVVGQVLVKHRKGLHLAGIERLHAPMCGVAI